MLIQGILNPTILFGSELWGMHKKAVRIIQRIQRAAICEILRVGRGQRRSSLTIMAKALNITPIKVATDISRVRALKKWVNQRTTIRDLVNNPNRGKGNWVSGIRYSICRNRELTQEQDAVTAKTIMKTFSWERELKNSGVSGRTYMENNFHKTAVIFHSSILNPEASSGLQYLIKARLGLIPFSQWFARINYIDGRYNNECPFCHQEQPETMVHCLIMCPYWNVIRRKYLRKELILIRRQIANNDSAVVMQYLLGGSGLRLDLEVFTKDWLHHYVNENITDLEGDLVERLTEELGHDPICVKVAAYLANIMPKRIGRLNQLIHEGPSAELLNLNPPLRPRLMNEW